MSQAPAPTLLPAAWAWPVLPHSVFLLTAIGRSLFPGRHLCCCVVGQDLWASVPPFSLTSGAAPPPQRPGVYPSKLTDCSPAAFYLSITNPGLWDCHSALFPGSLPVVPRLSLTFFWITLGLLPALTSDGLLNYACPLPALTSDWLTDYVFRQPAQTSELFTVLHSPTTCVDIRTVYWITLACYQLRHQNGLLDYICPLPALTKNHFLDYATSLRPLTLT